MPASDAPSPPRRSARAASRGGTPTASGRGTGGGGVGAFGSPTSRRTPTRGRSSGTAAAATTTTTTTPTTPTPLSSAAPSWAVVSDRCVLLDGLATGENGQPPLASLWSAWVGGGGAQARPPSPRGGDEKGVAAAVSPARTPAAAWDVSDASLSPALPLPPTPDAGAHAARWKALAARRRDAAKPGRAAAAGRARGLTALLAGVR